MRSTPHKQTRQHRRRTCTCHLTEAALARHAKDGAKVADSLLGAFRKVRAQ